MLQSDSLWNLSRAAGRLEERALWGNEASVVLGDLARGSSLAGRAEELRGRSVLVATHDQLRAALALIELDGVARRLILCPSDLPEHHVPGIITAAAVDAVVSDAPNPPEGMSNAALFVTAASQVAPAKPQRDRQFLTEWILLTSGTTGPPKLVVHTLSTLTGPIRNSRTPLPAPVWSTFYDIRRYGGLQVLLRALLGGSSMFLSCAAQSTDDFLSRAGTLGVSHILGTPTHWWLALTSASAHRLTPKYVRLSGEIASRTILDRLRAQYSTATIVHAFASTEAGVAFEVGDGLEGFPATLMNGESGDVQMKVEDGSLRIRSPRTAIRYLNSDTTLADADGFVDTRDLVELRGDRYYFVGRRDGVINVGGQKVHPEEVEAVINLHPRVRGSLVRGRKSPITGAIVTAQVVLNTDATMRSTSDEEVLKDEILRSCRAALPPHKVPAAIDFVPALSVSATGKILRRDA